MTTLVISHNIFLNQEQRYALHAGDEVAAVGVSLPVWFQKGSTSEPAQEVFVKYLIRNKNEDIVAKTIDEGYEINVPIQNLLIPPTSSTQSLLDPKDGGCKFMHFRQFAKSKMIVKRNKKNADLTLVHNIEIRDWDDFLKTIQT